MYTLPAFDSKKAARSRKQYLQGAWDAISERLSEVMEKDIEKLW